jgi:hypothetical protein
MDNATTDSASAAAPSAENADATTNEKESEILQALDHLDTQYQNMFEKQHALLQMLKKLQTEEASLSKALALAEEQPKVPQRPARKKQDDAAVHRLQEALLASDDSDDDEPNNDNDEESSTVSIGQLSHFK